MKFFYLRKTLFITSLFLVLIILEHFFAIQKVLESLAVHWLGLYTFTA